MIVLAISIPDVAVFAAIPVACLAAIMLVRELFWDWFHHGRHRTLPRCPKCWYDMRGSTSLTCSECGHTAKLPQHLLKSKRRWRVVVLAAFLLIVGTVTVASKRLASVNWITTSPAFVLLWMVDDSVPPWTWNKVPPSLDQQLAGELWARYSRDELSLRQRRAIAHKQFAGTRWPIQVRTRPQWPSGVPVRVSLTGAFAGVQPRDLRATPRFPGALAVAARVEGNWLWQSNWRMWPARSPRAEGSLQCIGAPPAGTTDVTFDVVIDEDAVSIWTGTVRMPITVAGTVDGILTRIDAPHITQTLLERFEADLRITTDRKWLIVPQPSDEPLIGVTFALLIELLHDDEVVASTTAIWRYDEGSRGWRARMRRERLDGQTITEYADLWLRLQGDVATLANDDLTDSSYRMRVRGRGELALWDFDATNYWSGEFSVPCAYAPLRPPP